MLSKKVLALLIPTMFSGAVLADSMLAPDASYKANASGQVVFSGEVSAVACTLRIPTNVALSNISQATASGTTDYVGAYQDFSIALEGCTFQSAGTRTGVLALKDAATSPDDYGTLTNVAQESGNDVAKGVGVQIRYYGTKTSNLAEVLQFKSNDKIEKTATFDSDDGEYKFYFDAAIQRLGSEAVYAGAVEAKMDVEVAYK